METFETYRGPGVAMHGEIEYVIPDFPGLYKLPVVTVPYLPTDLRNRRNRARRERETLRL